MEAQAIERSMLQIQASSTPGNAQFDMNGNASNGGGLVTLPHSVQNEDPDDLFGLLADDNTTAYQDESELEGDAETTRQNGNKGLDIKGVSSEGIYGYLELENDRG
ncbi:hypothetical protein LTR46_001899 [Exophiala xenobiotica]|nr:hypothetical protein LTR46_001899 [Exophiala xenobiotica]